MTSRAHQAATCRRRCPYAPVAEIVLHARSSAAASQSGAVPDFVVTVVVTVDVDEMRNCALERLKTRACESQKLGRVFK